MSEMSSAGQVALVTGATRGIGAAIAQALAARGMKVIGTATTEEGAGKISAALAAYPDCQGVALDVNDAAAADALIDTIVKQQGALHVLVNNAGISGAAKLTHEVSEQEWDRVQAVNVKGVFFCTKHAIPLLRRAGGGSIVNLSSIAGLVGTAGVAPYHASKGAVRLMTKNDAVSYAADRIRVNSVHPGYIWTPMVEQHLRATSTDLDAARRGADALHPLGHMGEPDDIAWAVVYLASDEAKFVTGAELAVDGGYTAR